MILNVEWQYIILRWPTNGVYRAKKRTDGPPPVVDSNTDPVSGDSWHRTAPAARTYDGNQYDFAFWSITGIDADSNQTEAHVEFGRTGSSSHPGNPAYGAGTWNIKAKAYYVRDLGSGAGDHGVFIDAFDVQAGDFIANDFVDVLPDDASLTLTANANDGYIDTSTQILPGQPINITARQQLDEIYKSLVFQNWEGIDSFVISADSSNPAIVGEDPNPRVIVAHNGDIIYAFAFYNEIAGNKFKVPTESIYDRWWWIRTHGGLLPPGPNPEPWLKEYMAVLSIAEAASRVSPKLRKSILKVALQQIEVVVSDIEKEVNKKTRQG